MGPASVETAVLEAVERESDTDRAGEVQAGRSAEVEAVEVGDSEQAVEAEEAVEAVVASSHLKWCGGVDQLRTAHHPSSDPQQTAS